MAMCTRLLALQLQIRCSTIPPSMVPLKVVLKRAEDLKEIATRETGN
ncbi:hypothetical protein IG631_13209 [Alternaria alternata]|nr:hypothetical protein IG631_13209 [Alternaria alternata]